jgi:hypothetical protein
VLKSVICSTLFLLQPAAHWRRLAQAPLLVKGKEVGSKHSLHSTSFLYQQLISNTYAYTSEV